jgi:uncharacterized protein YlzI (FlbEa/FlbD family)
MPLIKLNRINKGGEIFISSEHLLYAEVESRTTTLHMTNGSLFSVEESLAIIAERIEAVETARLKNAFTKAA